MLLRSGSSGQVTRKELKQHKFVSADCRLAALLYRNMFPWNMELKQLQDRFSSHDLFTNNNNEVHCTVHVRQLKNAKQLELLTMWNNEIDVHDFATLELLLSVYWLLKSRIRVCEYSFMNKIYIFNLYSIVMTRAWIKY